MKFGVWHENLRMPVIILEVGTAVRQFASPLGERTSTVKHGDESFSYRVVGPMNGAQRALDVAVVAQIRLGVGLSHGVFVAVDAEIGGVAGGASTPEMTSSGALGSPDIAETSVVVLSGLGVAGIRGNVGHVNLGVEVAGGGRTLTYAYESHYHACEQTDSISASMPVLEGRARASYWVSPYVYVGATVGKSLIDESWMSGVVLGANSRAFGGR